MTATGDMKTVSKDKIREVLRPVFAFTGNPFEDDLEEAVEEALRLARDNWKGVASGEEMAGCISEALMSIGCYDEAKRYIYLQAQKPSANTPDLEGLLDQMEDIAFESSRDLAVKRENANIDGDTPMGIMLRLGSEAAKQLYLTRHIKPRYAKAHLNGDIHIHDLDFYAQTTTCTQIDLLKLFHDGFSTGHGRLREPKIIQSYSALACIAIQSNQNNQHGGQSIPNFDYAMAEGVAKSFRRHFINAYRDGVRMAGNHTITLDAAARYVAQAEADCGITLRYGSAIPAEAATYLVCSAHKLAPAQAEEEVLRYDEGEIATSYETAMQNTERETYQAMEALVHNLNTMHSRAGAQVPFSSLNYGTDTSPEGRLAVKCLLLATQAGLGGGETPIFPVQIFRVKEGVNYNPSDPNYDLFQLAMQTSAKRLFPNFAFQDAPFNAQYYKAGRPETEIAYMGCRTRVMGNAYDPKREISYGRGNLSFTSVNLPRLALKARGNTRAFYRMLDERLELIRDQLLERLRLQSRRKAGSFPFLMGQGVWQDSDGLAPDDEVGGVLGHGTLSIGFIGLAETLKALIGAHHGESLEAQRLGLEIIARMRAFTDGCANDLKLNFSLLATPAEGLSGRFVALDRERYGVIESVTDRAYYTNSFHVPVYYPISAFQKIMIEAPYHALTNGGHISYVEMDGDPSRNLDAFEKVIRCMHDAGVGYGSVNHPVDRDPLCGYTGVIGDACPGCGRKDGAPGFERIRRITGYLVGTLDRFNDAKLAEERDRVKHSLAHG